MNHPHRTQFPARPPQPPRPFLPTLTLLVALGLLSAPRVAVAQRGGLPNDLKTATDARPRAAEIDKFVAAQAEQLAKGKTPADQQAARNVLGRESSAVGGAASPSYQAVYSTAVNKHLLPLAKSPDPRVRLNAAIALCRVAQKTNSAALAPAAAEYAADPCSGVALWAAKAAQSILPTLAATGKRPKLSSAIVGAVVRHPERPELVQEAYRALTLGYPGPGQQLTPAAVPAMLPDVLRLVEARAEMFAKGMPVAPSLERNVAIFLTASRVWGHPKTDAKQHAQIIQQLVNLVGLAAQHAAARQGDNKAREPFTELMRDVGDALTVVGGAVKDPKLQAAAKDLTGISPSTDNDVLSARTESLVAAAQARFKGTKPAPQIDDSALEGEPVDEAVPATDEEDAAEEPPAAEEGDEGGEAEE